MRKPRARRAQGLFRIRTISRLAYPEGISDRQDAAIGQPRRQPGPARSLASPTPRAAAIDKNGDWPTLEAPRRRARSRSACPAGIFDRHNRPIADPLGLTDRRALPVGRASRLAEGAFARRSSTAGAGG